MKVGFLILAHQLPEQLNILIKQILSDSVDNYIFVHVSKKFRDDLCPFILKHNRVVVLGESIAISWGDEGILKAQFLLLRKAIESGIEYVCFLSGQDLIVKNGVNNYISENRDKLFMSVENKQRESKARLEYIWPKKFLKRIDTKFSLTRIKRKIYTLINMYGSPFNKKKIDYSKIPIRFYKKSMFWCSFPVDFGIKVLDLFQNNKEIERLFFEQSNIPEEELWGTMAYLFGLENKITGYELVWIKKFSNNHPPVITQNDISLINNQSRCFFARKFDLRMDEVAVNYFKELILKERKE